MRRNTVLLAALALVLALSAACVAPVATPAPPTKTPKPTFTPTPAWTPTTQVFPTATPVPPTATPEATATPAPTEVPPTATPIPAPRLTANQTVNVRRGPGTNYAVIGSLSGGQSAEVTGKNPAGNWWQFDYSGQMGWVIGDLVTLSGDTGSIQVAQNIPAPPPPPTARPQPTAVPQPTATAKPRYEFNIARLQKCERQPAGNWFEGTVYKGGQPANGYRVVFSYAPDGPWVTQPQISGPHAGYLNWNAGYYSHIINATNPKAGDWYVWIVDPNGARISELAKWHSTGPGEGCNQAVVDFDSR